MQTRFFTALLSIFVFGSTLLKAQPSSAQTITGTVSFVNRLGDGVLSYQSGDSLYVRVEDADRDVSATTADTLSVYLTSSKESTEEVYRKGIGSSGAYIAVRILDPHKQTIPRLVAQNIIA